MKELRLQFILPSAQQAAELHQYWSGTDDNVIINPEIKTPGKKKKVKMVLSKNILGKNEKRASDWDYSRA